jgi:hypothetical protein
MLHIAGRDSRMSGCEKGFSHQPAEAILAPARDVNMCGAMSIAQWSLD